MSSTTTAFKGILLLSTFTWPSCSQELFNLSFPDSFKFGVASSAYQIEGAWNESGKGPSSVDNSFHTKPYLVADGSNGDVACDSYHKYLEDIELVKGLNVNHYRFSIAWSRIFPTGLLNEVNPAGIEYYNNLINGLIDAGIEPWVTLYHFDIPETINKLGGWDHPNVVDYFLGYADLLFSTFGDRVKTWLTINEPITFCVGIPNARVAIDPTQPTGVTEYLCSLHVLRSHAKVYHLYTQKYRLIQRGRVALVVSGDFGLPATDSPADIEAAERHLLFSVGTYLHPLVYGNYPQVVIDYVANYSSMQGFPESRLPTLSLLERLEIQGAYDFVALNHYSSVLVSDNNVVDSKPTFLNDNGVTTSANASWGHSSLSWLKVYPEGFRKELKWLKDNYKNPEIVITEQGFVDSTGQLNDSDRINYLSQYLNQLLLSIHEDGVNVSGYTVWSILDNFEWYEGYTAKFGLVNVDFNDPNRTRTPKDSYAFYRNVIETRSLINATVTQS